MENAKKNVALLAGCQAMLFTNNVTLISLAALAGFSLADNKMLSTLPATAYVVGAALTTLPASFFMKRFGRRTGFQVGTSMGIVGAAVCCLALWLHSFWLLCAGVLVLGVYNAFGQYYRFAAADSASYDFKAKAISLVLTGGLAGGIIAPELSKHTTDMFAVPFLGAYASLILFCLITMVLLAFIRIPPPSLAERHEPVRPLAQIMAQPAFIVAVTGSALGYGVMSLLMTATPLAMGLCGHAYSSTALVIEWHVIGMFAPSFFTGSLIKRFGVLGVMLAGVALEALCVGVALSGVLVANFWWALVLLGVGWNFLYVGGTTLLTECYRVSEKAKAQGMHDFLVFLTTATSSFSSGLLMHRNGWEMLNYAALPVLAVICAALAWLALRRRAAAAV
ncbi:MAG: MFS transporter [Betaproteobacteria bacterium RIFCSPLOWO2_12_FULL_64_23]|nr:MAG: MFS transporter [Betaproteobacteria bacterium RIFCSPLOWO2_12_FULL_64_23]